MHKNRTPITFIFTLIVAIIALLLAVFFLHIIKNKNTHTSAVLTTLENKILRKRNTNILTQKIAEVDKTRQVINGYFFDPTHIDSFVGYLENLGVTAGTKVTVKSVEVSKTVSNIISIKLFTEGDFSNVIRTIKLLENSPYKIHIQQVFLNKRIDTITQDIKGVSTSKQIIIWNADISFTILSS